MKLHVEVTGSREPLLLIHGLGSASTAWKPLIPALTSDYQVIAIEYRFEMGKCMQAMNGSSYYPANYV